MHSLNKIFTVILVCTVLLVMLLFVTGCPQDDNAANRTSFPENTSWSFDSMELGDNNTSEEAEKERSMLSVFMSDAKATFNPNGEFIFSFLGKDYKGKWENAPEGVRVVMEEPDYTSASGIYTLEDEKVKFIAAEGAGRLEGYLVHYKKNDTAKNQEASDKVAETEDGKVEDSIEQSDDKVKDAEGDVKPADNAAGSEGDDPDAGTEVPEQLGEAPEAGVEATEEEPVQVE